MDKVNTMQEQVESEQRHVWHTVLQFLLGALREILMYVFWNVTTHDLWVNTKVNNNVKAVHCISLVFINPASRPICKGLRKNTFGPEWMTIVWFLSFAMFLGIFPSWVHIHSHEPQPGWRHRTSNKALRCLLVLHPQNPNKDTSLYETLKNKT